MLNRNSYVLGVLIGILFPAILFGLLKGIDLFTGGTISHSSLGLTIRKMLFVCAALNILPIRYYFVHGEVEDTGKGILIVTVLEILFITILLK